MYCTESRDLYEVEVERGEIRCIVLVAGGEIVEFCLAGDRFTDGRPLPVYYRELAAAC